MDAMQISEVESAVFTDISSDSLEYSTVTSQGAFSEYHEACIDEDILMLGGTLEKMNLNNSKMELNAFPENVSAKRTLMHDTQGEDGPKTPNYGAAGKRRAYERYMKWKAFPGNVSAESTLMRNTQEGDGPQTRKYAAVGKLSKTYEKLMKAFPGNMSAESTLMRNTQDGDGPQTRKCAASGKLRSYIKRIKRAFPGNVSPESTLMRDTQEEDGPQTPKYATAGKRKAQNMELADDLRFRPKAVPKRLKAMEEGHTPITTKDAQHLVANMLLHRMKRGVLNPDYIRSISKSNQSVAGTMKMSEKSLSKM